MSDKKPTTLEMPNGDVYRATVFRVTKSDEKGPREFTLLREDESVKVQEGMQFWIAYVKDDVLKAVVH